jgi:hypothetical protein
MAPAREGVARVWLYGTLAYCLVIALAVGLRATHHGAGGSMPPLLRVLFAPAMLSYGAQAIYAGQVRIRWGGAVDRDGKPITFWFNVGVLMAMGCYLLISGLGFESA